jgi:hypothetical protein
MGIVDPVVDQADDDSLPGVVLPDVDGVGPLGGPGRALQVPIEGEQRIVENGRGRNVRPDQGEVGQGIESNDGHGEMFPPRNKVLGALGARPVRGLYDVKLWWMSEGANPPFVPGQTLATR